jgi:hypothetical protein
MVEQASSFHQLNYMVLPSKDKHKKVTQSSASFIGFQLFHSLPIF